MKSVRPLWRISVAASHEAEDAVAEALAAILDCAVSSYFHVKTGVSTVSAFCEQRPVAEIRKNISTGLRRIKDCGLKIGTGKITLAKVRREDWAESWKRHFKPIEIGNVLLIKPSWSKLKPRKGQIVVVLDPGLGFGTGQHPTTAFCLHELVRCGTFEARTVIFRHRHRLGNSGNCGGETRLFIREGLRLRPRGGAGRPRQRPREQGTKKTADYARGRGKTADSRGKTI